MGTLRSSSSSLKLFPEKYYGDRDRGFFCPSDSSLTIPAAEICFLRPLTHKHVINLSYSLPKTLHQKKPIFLLSSLSSSSHIQTQVQTEETEINDIISQSKTVHVKFQLQRECSFGQQFHIVGDDPMFGLWEPSDAVPLNWSDGHVWTVELDIPTGKCIKFKIILKAGPENIIWQPGPDRTLQTWETENTITVCEDWDDAELQKVLEEEPTSTPNEEFTINAENITDPKEKFHIDTNSTLPGRRLVSNAKEDPAAISDEDMNRLILETNGIMVNVQDSESTTDEVNALSMNGLPLLVPGLSPVPTTHAKEASLKEVETNIFSDASIEADKIEELNVPELDQLDSMEVLDNDKQEQHQCEQVAKPELAEEQGQKNSKPVYQVIENDIQWDQEDSEPVDQVLENDIQWGRRTLQKFLANLGFQ